MKQNYLCLFIFLLVFSVSKINSITYLYSHGFADTGRQYRKYMREYTTRRGRLKTNSFYIMDGEVKTFNYPDAVCKPIFNIFKTSLGQQNELDALQNAYNEIKREETDIVLVGVSRGASAAATFEGVGSCRKVKAVVLISPFAHVYDVFKTDFFYRLFRKISRYEQKGKHPIDWLPKMNKNVPVLLVCSKTDNTVPCSSTIRLYKKLVSSGHNNAYLLVLNVGKHAKFLKSPEAEKFQNVTHAFYKKYGLKCEEKFALLGEPLLEKCKLSVKSCESYFGDIDQDHERQEDMLDKKFERLQDSFITLYASINDYFEKFGSKK